MSITGICRSFGKGFYESFRGMIVIFYLDKENNERLKKRPSSSVRQRLTDRNSPNRTINKRDESNVMQKVGICALLNGGVFLSSVLVFEYMLFPLLRLLFGSQQKSNTTLGSIWYWTEFLLFIMYETIWIIPLYFICKIINAFYFQDIANSAYRYSRGRPVSFPSISVLFADSVFSVVVQILFLIQATLTSYIPIYPIGYIIYMVQISLLYSLYSFEYKWFNMGWKLHERLNFIETNWPYFIGFGLPLALITQLHESWVISGCIFSLLFPIYILSGNVANPVTNVTGIHLQLFSPVIAVANLFIKLSIGSKTTSSPINTENR